MPLVAAVLYAVYHSATALDDPADDVPAAVRDALDEAFEDDRGGQLTFSGVAGGEWTRLYVFPPLSKPATIQQTLAGRDDVDELPTDSPAKGDALLVFADADRVLGSALVARRQVEVSCLVARTDWQPWVGAVRRGRPLRVIRTARRRPPLLAATATDRRSVRRCVRELPRLRG